MRHDALGRRELPVPNPGRFRLVESLCEDCRIAGCKAESNVFFPLDEGDTVLGAQVRCRRRGASAQSQASGNDRVRRLSMLAEFLETSR